MKHEEKLLERLLEEKQLASVDLCFAKHFSEKGHLFLAFLLAKAREGHLFFHLKQVDPKWREAVAASLAKLPDELLGDLVVQEDERFYLRRNWDCERNIEALLEQLLAQDPYPEVELGKLDERLLEEQKQAIFQVRDHCLSLIIGGPGRGKSFTAAKLVQAFASVKVVCAAPTGKATANLRQLLPNVRSETLHALLARDQKIHADLIVVDEASMIDAQMMQRLFAAIMPGTRLVLLGDQHQLPPVESGHLFADLVQSGQVVCTELTRCLRTDLREIIDMSAAVQAGKMVPIAPLPSLQNLASKIFEQHGYRILCPLRKGPFGVDTLNAMFHKEHCKRERHPKIPIMIGKNAPKLGLFNGDVGYVQKNVAHFGERTFAPELLPSFEYAYVLSVHKSQGSEYEKVIVLLPEGSEVFDRQMLYTAITRAKKGVEIFGKEETLGLLLQTTTARQSALSLRSTCTP